MSASQGKSCLRKECCHAFPSTLLGFYACGKHHQNDIHGKLGVAWGGKGRGNRCRISSSPRLGVLALTLFQALAEELSALASPPWVSCQNSAKLHVRLVTLLPFLSHLFCIATSILQNCGCDHHMVDHSDFYPTAAHPSYKAG